MKGNKIFNLILILAFFFCFSGCNITKREKPSEAKKEKVKEEGYAQKNTKRKSLDRKEQVKLYLNSINAVLINVQVTTRNLSQQLIPVSGAIKQMGNYIDTLESLSPPESMLRQHKMVLLSFKKIRKGFYMLEHGNRPISIKLVRSGRDLLRLAVNEILGYAKKEGIIETDKSKNQ